MIDTKLIRDKFCMLTYLPPEAVNVSDSLHATDYDGYVVRICVEEYHERLSEIEYPADWWEAFKERWLSRLPFVKVKYQRFALDVAYPQYVPNKKLGPSLPLIVPLPNE